MTRIWKSIFHSIVARIQVYYCKRRCKMYKLDRGNPQNLAEIFARIFKDSLLVTWNKMSPNMMWKIRNLAIFSQYLKRNLKNHSINTGLVCTHLNEFFMLNTDMTLEHFLFFSLFFWSFFLFLFFSFSIGLLYAVNMHAKRVVRLS